jgi:hypothetical protein
VTSATSFLAGIVLAGTVGALAIGDPDTAPGVRMPVEQSQAIKRQMLRELCGDRAFKEPGCRMSDFELDHIVSLCLGGSNDRSNLQLQPWPEARRKDQVERQLCRAVDRGDLSREEAVRIIKGWRP